jgi:aminodeoxychorismate synthase component I
LDSGGGWTRDRENYFILFRNPSFSLRSNGEIVTVNLPDKTQYSIRDPISLLEGYLKEGYFAVGYIGYEFSRFTQEGFIPMRKKEGESFPDTCFLFYKKEDMVSGKIHDLKYLILIPSQKVFDSVKGFEPNMTKEEYIKMVKCARRYIEGGDVYQVNLSQRFTASLKSSPLSYFVNLYDVQPVPFGCYMDFGGFQLVSGSMELFLRKIGRKLVTKPIKGTRKGVFKNEADAIIRAELVSSEKERAENLMIVDLMRNDLGRVCNYGTVKVNGLFNIESYSTLHQMVSEIEGQLRDEIKINEIIWSTFPPGSVTGAPKRRALEIIDELEPHLRGPYCGALGIFSPDGDFTISVAIRVLVTRRGKGTFWAGAGIVWDSDPEKEYEETLVKAMATKKAMGIVE